MKAVLPVAKSMIATYISAAMFRDANLFARNAQTKIAKTLELNTIQTKEKLLAIGECFPMWLNNIEANYLDRARNDTVALASGAWIGKTHEDFARDLQIQLEKDYSSKHWFVASYQISQYEFEPQAVICNPKRSFYWWHKYHRSCVVTSFDKKSMQLKNIYNKYKPTADC